MRKLMAWLLTIIMCVGGTTGAFAEVDLPIIANEEELRLYIWDQLANRPDSFVVPLTSAWSADDLSLEIQDVISYSGVLSYGLALTYDEGQMCYSVYSIQYLDNFVLCDSDDEVLTAMKNAHEKPGQYLYVCTTMPLFQKLSANGWERWYQLYLLAGGTPNSCSFGLAGETCIVLMQGEWTDVPCVEADDSEAYIDCLLYMGARGENEFRIITTGELFSALHANNYALLAECEGRALIIERECTSYQMGSFFHYTNVEYENTESYITSVEQLQLLMEKETAVGSKEIRLYCSPEMLQLLVTEEDGRSCATPILNGLCGRFGIAHCNAVQSEYHTCIVLADLEYTTGYRIQQAVENGEEKMLSETDRAVLLQARQIVSAARDNQPEVMLWHILKTLADRVDYVVDDSTNTDDCATGALLEGRANCDGYSDAFALCAYLSGIPALRVDGTAPTSDPDNDGHEWVIVQLSDGWYLVDPTFCDQDGIGAVPSFFLLGADRSQDYVWSDLIFPPLSPVTKLNRAPVKEYCCDDSDDLAGILRNGAASEAEMFLIYFTSAAAMPELSELSVMMINSGLSGWKLCVLNNSVVCIR